MLIDFENGWCNKTKIAARSLKALTALSGSTGAQSHKGDVTVASFRESMCDLLGGSSVVDSTGVWEIRIMIEQQAKGNLS